MPPLAHPKVAPPSYGTFNGQTVEMTGALAMKAGSVQCAPGDTLTFRVDDKVYSATAPSATMGALMRDLRAQMQADGRTVVVKEYALGVCSLRVTG